MRGMTENKKRKMQNQMRKMQNQMRKMKNQMSRGYIKSLLLIAVGLFLLGVVTAFLLLSFLLGGGAVCLLVSKRCLSIGVRWLVKSMGLRGVGLFLVGAILRGCLDPSPLFMMDDPSDSGLPDLNEPAAPEEPLLEPQEASREEFLRVKGRLEGYAQRVSGQPTPPQFGFFEVSLPKTLKFEEGVSRARLQALESFITEAENRLPAGGSVEPQKALLRLKTQLEEWEARQEALANRHN